MMLSKLTLEATIETLIRNEFKRKCYSILQAKAHAVSHIKKNATSVVNLPKTQMPTANDLFSTKVSTHGTPHSIFITAHKKQ
jgi:hypothetical protein